MLLLQQAARTSGVSRLRGAQNMVHQQHAQSWSWLLQVHHPASHKVVILLSPSLWLLQDNCAPAGGFCKAWLNT